MPITPLSPSSSQTFWIHILNVAAQGAVWTIPLLFLAFPHLGDLTLSAIGSIVVSYIKSKYFPT